jgi:hypothetical protein
MHALQSVVDEALRLPVSAIPYFVHRRLGELRPGCAVVSTRCDVGSFEEFAAGAQCELEVAPLVDAEHLAWGHGPGERTLRIGALTATWEGERFELLALTWARGSEDPSRCWVIGASRDACEAFIRAAVRYSPPLNDEVLVFEEGRWIRSAELYQAIQSSTFHTLVLPESHKRALEEDFTRFFASRELYAEYDVPWKRGALFVGPPGNGKTHAVKAIANTVRVPCLYVKSFKSICGTHDRGVRDVFDYARSRAPCILVLEDLDALINDENRSFFLNELDGFAANHGVFAVATTNHPERIDTAILDRPSRFDRKFHFDLPAAAERRAFVTSWNGGRRTEMKLSPSGLEAVVERTAGFSFAYLKELCLAATLRWFANRVAGEMDGLMLGEVATLRGQMSARGV